MHSCFRRGPSARRDPRRRPTARRRDGGTRARRGLRRRSRPRASARGRRSRLRSSSGTRASIVDDALELARAASVCPCTRAPSYVAIAERDRGERRHRAGDADDGSAAHRCGHRRERLARGARDGVALGVGRRIAAHVALGEPHAADVVAVRERDRARRAIAVDDLRAAAADVEDDDAAVRAARGRSARRRR